MKGNMFKRATAIQDAIFPQSTPVRRYHLVKRIFDITFSTGALIVGFIPSLFLCAIVAANTKGSPIYIQERAGLGGQPFRIFKFRTMVADADDLEKSVSPEQIDAWTHEVKVENDPRVTKLGHFLRSISVDEFPQFANVLLGQMSVVGPRPISFEELEFFFNERDKLLSCKPGITGLWQTGPRNDATFESGLRQAIELAYVENANLALDAKIILRTFRAIVKREGQ